MICAYILHSKKKPNAEEAMKFYGDKRTLDQKVALLECIIKVIITKICPAIMPQPEVG